MWKEKSCFGMELALGLSPGSTAVGICMTGPWQLQPRPLRMDPFEVWFNKT